MAYDFNKEEEVKEFLDNLGIEYRFGCFSEKNPTSCHLLGDYLEAVKRDDEKAAKIYRSNCDDSAHPKSCFKYANCRFLGKGTKRDLKDALQYYLKGCSAGDGGSCLNGGLLCVSDYNDAVDIEPLKDYKVGLELLTKACDMKIAFSCHYIAGMYMRGIKDFIEKDMKNAYHYSEKACSLGSFQACANVSQMYRKGDGVEKNLAKFEEYKKVALELQEQLKSSNITFQQGT